MMREDTRRRLTIVVAYGSWAIALCIALSITIIVVLQPPTALPTDFQRIGGMLTIVFMGTGIGAGTALSRMRLATTITKVAQVMYQAGLKAGMDAFEQNRKRMK